MIESITEEHRAILVMERLILVQEYKGFILVECRYCKDHLIFAASEDSCPWSCERCDKRRLQRSLLFSPRKKRARRERTHPRSHRSYRHAA